MTSNLSSTLSRALIFGNKVFHLILIAISRFLEDFANYFFTAPAININNNEKEEKEGSSINGEKQGITKGTEREREKDANRELSLKVTRRASARVAGLRCEKRRGLKTARREDRPRERETVTLTQLSSSA